MRPESLYFLFSPLTRIKGVGGTTAVALQRLLPPAQSISGSALPIVRDLLFHLPVGIVDRRFTCPLNAAHDGVVATFVVTVDEHIPPPPVRRYGGKKPYKVLCSNDSGDITLVFFHASVDYIKSALPLHAKRVISGRVEHFDYRLQMTHPDIIAPVEQLAAVQKPDPVYPLTVGLTSRRIGKIVDDALAKLPKLPEWIERESLEAAAWPAWKAALRQAHHPQSPEDLLPDTQARRRLAYDEILANQLYLALLRNNRRQQAGAIIRGTGRLTAELLAALPFRLTAGQQAIAQEIYADIESGKRMGRLLQGDVGSGKTVVALLAMLRAAEQGLQSALMGPTEIIAHQHFEAISKLVAGLGVKAVLLTGGVKGRAREKALAEIASGEAAIIIGTHALFQEHVEFKQLALAIIDEQHRFGVGQRMALTAKGDRPHLLHMSATPIPRSLTMTLYGDMDCSQLLEKPAGRAPVATRVIPLSRYGEMMERLRSALEKGEKIYWICPLIEEKNAEETLGPAPENDIAAVQSRHTEFRARFGEMVGLVHGRMKADERDDQMRRFVSGETRLLVATTVVEVGVDVPDATIMVIEKAERFGLSQLHQLRGRVGRGDKPSACVLLYSENIQHLASGIQENVSSLNTESRMLTPALARLSILRNTDDGFRIAEEDLRIRGGGDLLGSRQSGMPRFIFSDMFRDRELIARARDEARALLKADPQLSGERGRAMKILLQLFGYEQMEVAADISAAIT